MSTCFPQHKSQPKGFQVVLLLPSVEYNKAEGTTTINWNWNLGLHKYDINKTGWAFVYKWVLGLGWLQIRAWQTESFESLSKKVIHKS